MLESGSLGKSYPVAIFSIATDAYYTCANV